MKPTLRTILFYAVLLGLSLLGLMLAWGAQLSFAWDRNREPDIAGYRFYFTEDPIFHPFASHVPREVGNTNYYTISNLVYGIEYSFTVTAFNSNGLESDFCENTITYRPAQKDRVVTLVVQSRTNALAPWTNRLTVALTNKIGVSNEVYRLKIQ